MLPGIGRVCLWQLIIEGCAVKFRLQADPADICCSDLHLQIGIFLLCADHLHSGRNSGCLALAGPAPSAISSKATIPGRKSYLPAP